MKTLRVSNISHNEAKQELDFVATSDPQKNEQICMLTIERKKRTFLIFVIDFSFKTQ